MPTIQEIGEQDTIRAIVRLWNGPGEFEPGLLILQAADGNDHYLWQDNDGRLRIHTEQPTQDTDGVLVSSQF